VLTGVAADQVIRIVEDAQSVPIARELALGLSIVLAVTGVVTLRRRRVATSADFG